MDAPASPAQKAVLSNLSPNLVAASELAGGNFIGGLSTCVYRREIIAALKPRLWELDIREWFFNIVVAEHGPIGYVSQILSVYRAHPEGIWGCTFVGECTRVCPKHVDPAGAIQQYKLKAALDWVKSFVTPLGRKNTDVRREAAND